MLKKVFHKGQMPSPKRMNFWRSGVIFNPEIYDADRGPFEHEIDKNLQHDVPKMRVGSIAVSNFSENSSVLVMASVPKYLK